MSQKNIKNLSALYPFFKPYKFEILLAFLALLVTAFTILFFGKIIKYLIDYGFVEANYHFLNLTLIGFIAAVVIMAIAGYFRSSLINAVAEKVICDLRKKAYNHIIKVSAQFFEINKTGDVISRLTLDTQVIYGVISNTISFLLRNLLFFIGGIILLIFTSPKLSLISLMIIPLAIAPIIFLGKKVKNLSHKAQESMALVGSHIEESVNAIQTIQAYLCDDKESKNFNNLVNNSLKITLEKIKAKSLMVALVIALAFGGISLVLFAGGKDVLNGTISSGDLSSFIFYAVITATSLVSLSQISSQLQAASASTARIFTILDLESPVQDPKNPKKLSLNNEITINFNNVNFAYPSNLQNLILNNFNLTIKPQEKLAIVGSSGSGKSTILQVLMRFYDVNSGDISLNNINIKDLTLNNLRQNFAYIAQDCFIFSGTIYENIAYVNKDVTEEQVQKIIDENEALHFINNLKDKMHSLVGEKGIKLSGGERQRIAIARAIIKDSPILLLDEATSALDNNNERIISDAIAKISKNKSVITVAHRLATVINADRIIFIENGKISETGTHKTLIKLDGNYKKLYEIELLSA